MIELFLLSLSQLKCTLAVETESLLTGEGKPFGFIECWLNQTIRPTEERLAEPVIRQTQLCKGSASAIELPKFILEMNVESGFFQEEAVSLVGMRCF